MFKWSDVRAAAGASLQLKTALGLALIALIWGSIVAILVVQRDMSQRGAAQNTRNLARVFEEHVVRAIKDTDKTLLFLRSAYEKAPAGFDLQTWVDREYFRNDLTLQLAVIGADGYLVSTNVGPVTQPMDLSDREHFRVHLNNPNDEIFISKPVLGRATGKWSVQLTRKITGADGSFRGVVVASLDPWHFSRFYESVDLGRDGAITLAGLDGIIRARGGMDASGIGKSAASSAAYRLLSKSPVGTFEGGGVVDGVRRLVSYRVVDGYPLVVMVGMSERDIYAQLEQWRAPLLTGGTGATVLLLCVIGLGIRHRLRLNAATRDLETARDTAEAASKAKTAFLAVMSHEMRTPLNGIIGALDLLQRTNLVAEQPKYVQAALTSSEALLAQITDVLDFSKMEAGKLVLETSAVELHHLVKSVLAIIGPQASEYGNVLVSTCDPRLPARVIADPVRLRQVLLNFLSNAAKFTREGQIAVHVGCVGGSSAEPLIEFAVCDTGAGIPADRLGCLFQEFSMVDASYARNAGGTGLGLAICKRLAIAMHGEIGVESEPGRGSRFWIRVPLRACTETELDAAAAQELAQAARLAKPLHVLLVDDNPTNQMVAGRMLAAAGHLVDTAGDGRVALAHASKVRFDAILMDISMPEMDGMEATRRIRRLPEPYRSVPIVALTANAVAGDRQQFLSAGMTDYLTKPFRRAELEAVLGKVTAGTEGSRQTNAAEPVPTDARDADVPLVDTTELETLARETSPEMVTLVLDQYLAELQNRLNEFETARASGRMDEIGRIAHAIAGSAASVGALRLRHAAKALEASCKALEAPEAQRLAELLPALADQTSVHFRDTVLAAAS